MKIVSNLSLETFQVEPQIRLNDYLQLPIQRGRVSDKVDPILDGDSLASVDLVAIEDVPALGFFGRQIPNIS